MLFVVTNGKVVKWLMLLLLCSCGDVSPKNPYKSGEARTDYPKGCAYLRCKRGDQCVNRKFWCKNPPCPSMLYCSKTRKESLKGPSTCEAVRCSKGFVCLVRARHCRWGKGCEQQIARCISERDYYEGPASCADFRCPSGHRCILRESLCAKAPCKLLKSCANTKDVNSWFEGCKNLGCLSEHECFLRRPDDDCTNTARCKHRPDCLAKSEEEVERNEQCRGWVCPRGQECSSHAEEPCAGDTCGISRSCHRPMIVPANSTGGRKHSWKDDIKLTFYSKFEKNNSPRTRLSIDKKTSRESGASGNRKILTNTAIEKMHDRPIYKAPVYVTATPRQTSAGPSFASPNNTSARQVQPTVTSLSTWLDHLKLKTGVDAVQLWIRKAEKQESYGEFVEWLESVKDMLGSKAYDLWLEEVRAMTVTSRAFQKWLPTGTSDSVQQHENSGKLTNEGLEPDIRNSMTFRPNEDYHYLEGGNINGKKYETGSVKSYNSQEEDYMFPPHATPPTTKTQILPTIAPDESSQFYPPNSRFFLERTYPFHENIATAWAEKTSRFRDFDRKTNPTNLWYDQFSRNWSFEKPVSNLDVWRPETAARQNQFVPPPPPPPPPSSPRHQQWQQERDSRDRFLTDRRIESTRTPTDTSSFLVDHPLGYYSGNSANEDTSWMKYFLLNPHETSELVRARNIGSFPINDETFDGYASQRWSGDKWRATADVPRRRSKHEDSVRDFERFPHRDRDEEDRSADKFLGVSEDTGLYDPRSHWPIVDPSLREYYRYLVDYNEKNREENKYLKDLSSFHRIDVQPRSQSPNRYGSDGAGEHPPSEYHSSNYHRQNNFPITSDRRGYSFRDREYESPVQPLALPDLWDPRYRTALSSIVSGIDAERANVKTDMMEKVVPVVSFRRRVIPNLASQQLPYEENDDYREDGKNPEDYSVDDEEEAHPVLLSVQGYIEPSDEGSSRRTINLLRNTTILPAHTNGNYPREQDDCTDYYSGSSDVAANDRSRYQHEVINVFKNPKYGGDPDFPNYLKSVLDVEAAIIMRNITGERDVEIKSIKWEYEDEDDRKFVEDSVGFTDRIQKWTLPTSELATINKDRDSVGNTKERAIVSDDDASESYYYEGTDYVDKNYPDLEQIDGYGLLNVEEIGDYLTNRVYKDPDHKRLKKNRSL